MADWGVGVDKGAVGCSAYLSLRLDNGQFPVPMASEWSPPSLPSAKPPSTHSFSCFPALPVASQYPGSYLTFEVVSLVPYDRNLIDVSLLSPEHVSDL